MIISEKVLINRRKYLRTYSDNNKKILQNETGLIYNSAVDVYPCKYTYSETIEDIPLPPEEPINEENEEENLIGEEFSPEG